MNPYRKKEARELSAAFYGKYYNDYQSRIIFYAINPGRLGAGITGVPFTDPARLEEICGIPNKYPKKKELSGGFLYEMMKMYGGVEKFYRDFFLTSLCPLGFIKNGKNANYYDFRELENDATPFIIESVKKHKKLLGNLGVCICIGEGKNYHYFQKINKEHHLYSSILVVPHPRFIMQYRRKQKEEYIQKYLEVMEEAKNLSITLSD